MKALTNWLENRTGLISFMREALYERIPGGARWRYVWGSTLSFTFMVQVVTGIFLWMAYSPSSQTAWESVYYIQYEMTGGWLLRGIHHFTAQAMIVLLALHLMQVVVDGAYRAPREVNFWMGLILLKLVLGLSLTGYLLPWDQKGYWATQVATTLMAVVPWVGPELQTLVVGGTDYGHATLTRFFALHAGVLPGLMILFIGLHVVLFRKHGITAKKPYKKRDAYFWPDQVLVDGVACLAVLAVVLVLTMWGGFVHGFDDPGKLGAHLSAPADPAENFPAARPEWYFLFLFQLLKYFPGESEIYGAIVIPGAVAGLMFLMPLIGRWKVGHAFNVFALFMLLVAAGVLTGLALWDDSQNPEFHAAKVDAEEKAHRVVELIQAKKGIPPTGAVDLLRDDPLTQAPVLFAQYCAGCHRYGGHDGLGNLPADPQSAPELKGFASRKWLTDFFDPKQIATPKFYGNTAFKDGDMVELITEEVPNYSEEEKQWLQTVIMGLSAEAKLPYQKDVDEADATRINDTAKRLGGDGLFCLDCHLFHGEGEKLAPELTGYGSREWIAGVIHDPTHRQFFGKDNDRMPSFGRDKILTEKQINLIADWLRHDWVGATAPQDAQPPASTPEPDDAAAADQPDAPTAGAGASPEPDTADANTPAN